MGIDLRSAFLTRGMTGLGCTEALPSIVSIIDSILQFHTETALKKSKTQELLICFYIEGTF